MRTPRRSATPARPSRRDEHASLFEYATLLEFSSVINSSHDLRFILNHILLTIMGRLLVPRGMACLVHGEGKVRVELSKGFPAMGEGAECEVSAFPREILDGEALRAGRAQWIRRIRKEGAGLVLPLWLGERPVGFFAFGASMSNRRLKKGELAYLRSLADLSATAVQKSHTIAELEQVNNRLDRRVRELNTLFDLGKEFGALLDRERLIRLLVFSIMGQLGVNRYLISLGENADMRIVASRVDGDLPQGELLQGLTRLHRATLVEGLPEEGERDPRSVLLGLGLRVIVPVHLKGEARGLLLLGEKLSREPFSEADLEFLTSLGNLALIGLENSRLFEEALEKQRMEDELLIAREIQKGLLPSVLPALPGFDCAAANISSKQVGGDYYDVIEAEGGKRVIAIGDVSGKGTPAALLMANLQATIRALVPLSLPLGELTGRVNDLMCQNTGGNKFVTFFWGMIDPATRVLTYVNAGHNYPFLVRADGRTERLDRGGMILGVLPTALPYEEGMVEFAMGDRLILFTDGVSEAMSREGKEYGEERLAAVIARCAECTARQTVDRIHEDVALHARGATQSDDITMMVLRAVGPEA